MQKRHKTLIILLEAADVLSLRRQIGDPTYPGTLRHAHGDFYITHPFETLGGGQRWEDVILSHATMLAIENDPQMLMWWRDAVTTRMLPETHIVIV